MCDLPRRIHFPWGITKTFQNSMQRIVFLSPVHGGGGMSQERGNVPGKRQEVLIWVWMHGQGCAACFVTFGRCCFSLAHSIIYSHHFSQPFGKLSHKHGCTLLLVEGNSWCIAFCFSLGWITRPLHHSAMSYSCLASSDSLKERFNKYPYLFITFPCSR